ncbi:transposase [Lentzea tibetensis]|uniref:Transposase n=1 Tax=Lentzea tibetensis TaxID=2591470 RepID=A0A563EEZ2_9PSEU|nr:transposase [Lentzea tibetensis]
MLHPPIESAEYTAAATAAACRSLGIVQSMGRVGCALDNAVAEAFNSTLKVEFVHRQHFRTRAEARIKVATWISRTSTTPPGDTAPTTGRPRSRSSTGWHEHGRHQRPSPEPKWHNTVSTIRGN